MHLVLLPQPIVSCRLFDYRAASLLTVTPEPILATESAPNTAALVELISERVFWYIQRDSADKKLKKLDNDVKRCQKSSFGSAADVLMVQYKAVDLDMAKYAQRMSAIDANLRQASNNLWAQLEASMQSKPLAASRQDLTPPPSETSSDGGISVDEKLAQMRESLEATMRNQVADESKRLHSQMKGDYEAQIEVLKQDLDQERSLRTTLENRLEELSAKLGTVEAKTQKQAKRSAKLGQVVKQDAFDELESRMTQLEESFSEAQEQTKRVSSTEVSASNESCCMDADSTHVKQLHPAEPPVSNVKTLEAEVEAKLEEKIYQLIMRDGDKLVPNEKILHHVSALESKVQSQLKRMAEGFGGLIDKERNMRAGLGTQVKNSAQTASVAVQELGLIKADMAAAKTSNTTNYQEATATLELQANQLQNLTSLVASTSKEIETERRNTEKSMEAVCLRLGSVSAWQANFSTRALFEAIVRHLNDTWMHEHVGRLGEIRHKVAAMESQLAEVMGAKRRKLSPGMSPGMPPGMPPAMSPAIPARMPARIPAEMAPMSAPMAPPTSTHMPYPPRLPSTHPPPPPPPPHAPAGFIPPRAPHRLSSSR